MHSVAWCGNSPTRAPRSAEGEALAISIPRTETAVIRHFQEQMPYGPFVPDVPTEWQPFAAIPVPLVIEEDTAVQPCQKRSVNQITLPACHWNYTGMCL
jgi:hypothetical protein